MQIYFHIGEYRRRDNLILFLCTTLYFEGYERNSENNLIQPSILFIFVFLPIHHFFCFQDTSNFQGCVNRLWDSNFIFMMSHSFPDKYFYSPIEKTSFEIITHVWIRCRLDSIFTNRIKKCYWEAPQQINYYSISFYNYSLSRILLQNTIFIFRRVFNVKQILVLINI